MTDGRPPLQHHAVHYRVSRAFLHRSQLAQHTQARDPAQRRLVARRHPVRLDRELSKLLPIPSRADVLLFGPFSSPVHALMENCISTVWGVEKGSVLRIREGGVSFDRLSYSSPSCNALRSLALATENLAVDRQHPVTRACAQRALRARPARPIVRQRYVPSLCPPQSCFPPADSSEFRAVDSN
jgi:hypothetical protein